MHDQPKPPFFKGGKNALALTFILLLLMSSRVAARQTGPAITYTGKRAMLVTVFQVIREQTGYSVFASKDLLKETQPVTCAARNMPLRQFLDLVLQNQDLGYEISNKTIFLKRKTPVREDAQPGRSGIITGAVKSETGDPITRATVMLDTSSKGAITDEKGVYVFKNMPEGFYTLTASCIGFNKSEQQVYIGKGAELHVNFVLTPNAGNLKEVVVNSGYQTFYASKSPGAYAKPDMQVLHNRSSSMNILQRLDGLVPGLTVNNAPSASSAPLLIRGLTSINSNKSPLVVVDGVPLDNISSVNPQDVEDITVLKDAAASSIWGARAANGVIVIATKKGAPGDGLLLEYDGFVNFQGRPDVDYYPVLDSRQFIQAAEDIFRPDLYPWTAVSAYTGQGSRGVPPHNMILYNRYRGLISDAQARESLDSLANINNTSQIRDMLYRPAMLTNHTLSVRGGGKAYAVYGSLAYTGTQSNKPGEKNNAYKINIRQDYKVNNHISLFLITDLNNTTTSARRAIDADNRFLPYQLFSDAAGNSLSIPYVQSLTDSTRKEFERKSGISLDYNPLNESGYGYTKSDLLSARITAGVTVKLLKGLTFNGVYGLFRTAERIRSFDDERSYSVRSEVVQFTVPSATSGGKPAYYLPATGGRYALTNSSQRNWTVRNQLQYMGSWNNGRHQLSALAGQEAQEQLTTLSQSIIRGYDEQLQTYPPIDYATLSSTGIAGTVMPNNGTRSLLAGYPLFTETAPQVRFLSYYGNLAYTLNNRYTVSGSLRLDQSNLFGKDRSAQNKPVWSMGARWNITEEDFMGRERIGNLALRVSYGLTGNSPVPGTAASYDILEARSGSSLPGNRGLAIVTPANNSLTWERTGTLNIGLDFSTADQRLSASADLYSKHTENLIGVLEVNPLSGYSSVTGNFGNMKNTGVEISLRSINLQAGQFRWITQLVLAYNKNRITRLNQPALIATGAQKAGATYLAGYPAFGIFAYNFAGLDSLGDPLIRLQSGKVSKERNAALPEDVLYMGTYQPVWNGGLSNIFSYRNLELAVNMVYNFGNVMRRDVNGFYGGNGLIPLTFNNAMQSGDLRFRSGNVHEEFASRWKQAGDEYMTNVPSWVPTTSLNDSRRDTRYYTQGNINVISAAFIKIRDVSLAYNMPHALVSRVRLNGVKLRLQVSNLMVWKNNHYGIDPEFQDASGGSTAGAVAGGIRYLRANQGTVTAGINVRF
ncbi:SusC/RagA family TonB-linked outer membrane protein [Chitinophaga sp.]|uniref:SusC/RagA family TonB-linked outer membrane protein n=1 Tax=Chitinophaga sp. TaxID=1869181 RepID=UPI002CDBB28E|nr:SusC/RagA family TonB-linked outer membrane protein [Chitinophaga sp.]HWV66232.1 SusC/RagA family TonB-linked outer membrane protein [Chitinophaga sp.]